MTTDYAQIINEKLKGTMAELVALHGRARGGISARLVHLGLVDPAAAPPPQADEIE